MPGGLLDGDDTVTGGTSRAQSNATELPPVTEADLHPGWRQLDEPDNDIDELLGSESGQQLTELLRRYRNGVFHYQRDYWDQRLTGFWMQGAASAAWSRSLNNQFGRWFLSWFDMNRAGAAGT